MSNDQYIKLIFVCKIKKYVFDLVNSLSIVCQNSN